MTSGVLEAHYPLVVSPNSLRRTLGLARRALRALDAVLLSPEPDVAAADDARDATLSAEIVADGERVALVVRDAPGRQWSDDDRAMLRDLAETLGEEIRLTELVARLEAKPPEAAIPSLDAPASSELSIPAEAAAAQEHVVDEHSSDGQASDATMDPASLRILLADDLDLNRKLICDMLSLDGYVVDSVADGAAAVEAAKATAYDLILMDMIMPGMDGVDATRAIRALPAPACDVAIVALTAHSFREQLDNCLDAGMNATLTKPMTFDALSSAVAEWAGRRNAA